MYTFLQLALAVLIALGAAGCGEPEGAAPPASPEPEAALTQAQEPVTVSPPAETPEPPTQLTETGKLVWSPDLWQDPPRGLPAVPDPSYNRTTVEKVELGRRLYFDKRLSKDGTISCASCHHPALGFSNAQPLSPGIGGQLGTRNSPTVYNSAYNGEQFWDGREKTLEHQALGPITNPVEMGNTIAGLLETVSQIPEYTAGFRKAFGDQKISEWKVAEAIAAFERTILTGDAPFDRFKAGATEALSPEARRGVAVFEGKGRCVLCHLGPNFSDNQYHNVGVGTQAEKVDVGRMEVTKDEKDWAKFKTPTLRNVAVTGPYMHDGSIRTLEEVVEQYDKGGIPNKNLDPLYQALGLTAEEKADLVTFLKEGLTRELEVPEPTYVSVPGKESAAPESPEGGGEAPAETPSPPETTGERGQ